MTSSVPSGGESCIRVACMYLSTTVASTPTSLDTWRLSQSPSRWVILALRLLLPQEAGHISQTHLIQKIAGKRQRLTALKLETKFQVPTIISRELQGNYAMLSQDRLKFNNAGSLGNPFSVAKWDSSFEFMTDPFQSLCKTALKLLVTACRTSHSSGRRSITGSQIQSVWSIEARGMYFPPF